MMANVGMARPMLTTATAITPPRRTWPRNTATGTATTAATATDKPERRMWSHTAWVMPLRPSQLAPVVM